MKRISTLVLIALLFAGIKTSLAQTVLTEGFDNAIFPPLGWNMGKIGAGSDANNICERVTAASNPAGIPAATQSGAGMCRYKSGYMVNAGEMFFLSTKRLDMTNTPAGGATVTFWMYRDNVNTFNDSVFVCLNDSANIASYTNGVGPGGCQRLPITQVAPAAGPLNFIPRYFNNAPVVTANTWVQYSVTIPQAGWNNSNVYLLFGFTDRNNLGSGGNIYIDNISINTYPKQQSFTSAAISFQNSANVAPGATYQLIIGAKVVIDGAGNPLTAGDQLIIGAAGIQFNTNGTTSLADIAPISARLYWTGATNNFTGIANAIPVGVAMSTAGTNFAFAGGAFKFDNGDNYFWLTYDVAGSAVAGNCLDAEFIGLDLSVASGTNPSTGAKVPSPYTLPGCRTIDVVYCGGVIPQYVVGTSWLGGSYTNNDYVQSVVLVGDNAPGINTNLNAYGPAIAPWNNQPAPFTYHPLDYEKMLPGTMSLGPVPAPYQMHPQCVATVTSNSIPNTYNVTYQCGTWFSSNYIAGFIDWNHDGDFIDIVAGINEKIWQSGSMTSNQSLNATITVPYGGGTYLGATTLRVREWYAQSNIDPCSQGYYGEVEDYQLIVVPSCGAIMPPGFNKIWLGGFDNDWNNPLNWCPKNPPTAIENTVIPGGTPFKATIKNGYIATTKKLRIDNDTVYINAPTGGSLTCNDSIYLSAPGSTLKVINAFSDTAVVSNGTLNTALNPAPVTNATSARQRIQLVYSQGELQGQGMIAGDQIDEIWLLLRTRASTIPYANFTVKYFYTSVGFCFNGAAQALAPVFIPGGVLFSGSLNLASQLAVGTPGEYKLPLTTPLTWNGGANPLVLEISYNNAAVSTSDQMYYTTNLGCRQFLQVYAFGPNSVVAGASLTPVINVGISGAAGANTITLGAATLGLASDLVVGMPVSGTGIYTLAPMATTAAAIAGATVLTFASTANVGLGMIVSGTGIYAGSIVISKTATTVTLSSPTSAAVPIATNITFTTGITAIAGATVTLSNNNSGIVSGSGIFGGALFLNTPTGSQTSINRPNLTFKFHRNYGVFPISLTGHWGNFGVFDPGYSNVTFNGSAAQNIAGTKNTTFYNLTVNTSNNTIPVTLASTADTITNLFTLTRGRYVLSAAAPAAIRTTNYLNGSVAANTALNSVPGQGMLVSENGAPNYGLFRWNIGTPPSLPLNYRIPFATTTGVQIPVDYTAKAGTTTLDLTLGTYTTPAANTPIPTGVMNIYQSTWFAAPGLDNSPFMVDRFWQINNAGPVTAADLVLSYSTAGPNENAASGAGAYSAQVYNPCAGAGCGWNYPYLPGQVNGANSVTVPNVAYTNTWALTRSSQPLPIELLDFVAHAETDKVRLSWSTASEVNNDFFTVERTTNSNDFDFIAKVNSQARGKVSNGILDYYTYDYKPLSGIQYYRLKQTDVDGKFTYSKLVPVEFGKKQSFEIKTVMNSGDGSPIKIYFAYDGNGPVAYKLIDLMGKTLMQGVTTATSGINELNIDGSKVSKGVYNLILSDATRSINRKLVP